MKFISLIILSLHIFTVVTSQNDDASPVYDTIVVGLGTSGLTALSKLARHGKKVLGLEAMDRIGGRVKTVPFGDGVLELGAEWIHGRNNSGTYELAVANNITVKNQDFYFTVYLSDGSAADQELIQELMENCVVDYSSDKPESIAQFYKKKCDEYISKNKPELLQNAKFIDEFYKFLNIYTRSPDAAGDWNEVTAQSDYEDLDNLLHTSWHKYGYKTLFEIILNKYNNGPGLPNADIKLKKEVSQISWPQDPQSDVVVHCTDGSEYRANNVIVTVSLGVLKARHATLFSPSLPAEKVEAIENISMGLLDKVILSFDEIWWPKNITVFAFVWKNEDINKVPKEAFWTTQITGPSTTMGSENVLVLWTTAEVAKTVEVMPKEVVKKQATDLLRRFMGPSVPEPKDVIRTDWFSNEYTRGSYTYDNLLMPQHKHLRDQLGAPLLDSAGKPRVLFAGEATNRKHYGTVHGAFETGIREANRLLGNDKNTLDL